MGFDHDPLRKFIDSRITHEQDTVRNTIHFI